MADNNDTSRSLALAALLASRKERQGENRTASVSTTVVGPKPDTVELWNWMQSAPGEFDQARAAEIRSHLAFDSDLYATWREFRHAQRDLAAETADPDANVTPINTPPTEQRWWRRPSSRVATGVGLAVAASLAAVLLLPQILFPPTPVDFWANWQVPKTSSARPLDDDEKVVLSVVLSGMHNQFEELSVPPVDAAGNPLTLANCGSATACGAVEDELVEFGQQLVTLRSRCLQAESPAASELTHLLELLPALQALPEMGLVHAPMRQLSQQAMTLQASATDTDASRALCNAIDVSIERVLLAR